MSNSINDYFDKIVYLNLDKRLDRKQLMEEQFEKLGWTVERITAVEGNPMRWKPLEWAGRPESIPGGMGCTASHLSALDYAKDKKAKRILILEDDCILDDNINEKFADLIEQVPKDWDLLYFGGVHETRGGQFMPEKVSDNILKIKRTLCLHCYGVNETMYNKIKEIAYKEYPYFRYTLDGYYAVQIQSICNSYCFDPPLAWQTGNFSDIQQGYRDYSEMMKINNYK
jgi:GR25 family glycosyltransferase involved in LPS biosynthesis